MAGGKASQKPEAGMSVTPTTAIANKPQPMDLGMGLGEDASSSATAKPQTNSIAPKSTNQTTAAVIGSAPTVLNTPRLAIEASTSPKTATAKTVCIAETPMSQRPSHLFMCF